MPKSKKDSKRRAKLLKQRTKRRKYAARVTQPVAKQAQAEGPREKYSIDDLTRGT